MQLCSLTHHTKQPLLSPATRPISQRELYSNNTSIGNGKHLAIFQRSSPILNVTNCSYVEYRRTSLKNNSRSNVLTFDRELLATYMAIKHLKKNVRGFKPDRFYRPQAINICTSEETITIGNTKTSNTTHFHKRIHDRHTSHQWEEQHSRRRTQSHTNRQCNVPTSIDYHKIAEAQDRDSDNIKHLSKQSNLSVKQVTMSMTHLPFYCEASTSTMRPYLPEECRREVFNALHNISHPGVRATRKLITGKFFWPSIQVDVGIWAKQCIQCQKCKVQRHTSSSLDLFPPTERFEHLHVDIVGPLPTSP
ncbi:unnamed protein product [Parnassius mnemosyne]|uniref:Integrase zinc-binding domain-containing protein n=1 Tax=Parnassius mnemosyne TaxID=213953 RepID=A0AAV1M528_9NEOP